MKSGDVLNYAKVSFYVLLGLSLLVCTYQWFKVDDSIDYFGEELNNILDKTQCDIDFKDFHYSGFCINTENAFEFIQDQYRKVPELPKPLYEGVFDGDGGVTCYNEDDIYKYEQELTKP